MDSEATEGGVYLCSWKKEGKGWRIAMKAPPNLEGSGATFGEARSRLRERILIKLGDGEPALDFDRPLPKGILPETYSNPEIIWVTGHDTALADKPAGLFEGGICTLCGNPVGKRNDKPALLSSLPLPKSDGAEARHIGSLFSDAFVKLLGDSKGRAPGFRETTATPSGKKKLYELDGIPVADFIAVDDIPLQGVKCAKCKRKAFNHMVGGDLVPFISLADLPDPPPEVFLVRNRETLGLCMTGEAWRKIQGKPGTVNVVGMQIGVAPAERVVRNPDLPLFKG